MKRGSFILLALVFFTGVKAQDEGSAPGQRVHERMKVYVQEKLGLTKEESEKFGPVFLRYAREQQQVTKDNRGDRLVLQQKIIELRIKYREQFTEIMGKEKAGKVFTYENQFRREALKILREKRRSQRVAPDKVSILLCH